MLIFCLQFKYNQLVRGKYDYMFFKENGLIQFNTPCVGYCGSLLKNNCIPENVRRALNLGMV